MKQLLIAGIKGRQLRQLMWTRDYSCKLGVVTAKAVTGQHTNGDVKEAAQAAEAAQNRYYSFIYSTAAKQIVRT